MSVPLLRPLMPPLHALAPYLERMDQTRIYSNFGPLVLEFEERLVAHHGTEPLTVVTLANATIGLTVALLAQDARPDSLCLMPAWTFVASPLAAIGARLTPYFVDVEAAGWALTPEIAEAAIAQLDGRVGAVMPVAPFGQHLDPSPWDAFRQRTGIPVVIDAAAAFDSARVGDVPSVVSLHATKALGCGEGGYIASRDRDLIKRIRTYLGFGFHGSRDAQFPGTNGKMSEYHAAVGLAGLDAWPQTRTALLSRAQSYRAHLRGMNGLAIQSGFGESWVANTLIVELAATESAGLETHLAARGIPSRHWWGRGAHCHSATLAFPHASLPETGRLASQTLGLPFFVDMSDGEIAMVAEAVGAFVS